MYEYKENNVCERDSLETYKYVCIIVFMLDKTVFIFFSIKALFDPFFDILKNKAR